jgi:hypothetical protein
MNDQFEGFAVVGPGGTDADGSAHAGMPWAGCAVLAADAAKLRQVRDKADRREDVLVVSLVGPRKAVDCIVGSLSLLP